MTQHGTHGAPRIMTPTKISLTNTIVHAKLHPNGKCGLNSAYDPTMTSGETRTRNTASTNVTNQYEKAPMRLGCTSRSAATPAKSIKSNTDDRSHGPMCSSPTTPPKRRGKNTSTVDPKTITPSKTTRTTTTKCRMTYCA